MLNIIASDLPRIMNCNGSISMGESHPPIESNDETKNEGTAVHWLAQQVLTKKFTAEELVDRKSENGVFITPEMVEHLEEYLNSTLPNSEIEFETSHGGDNWQINGRADRISYVEAGGHLLIDELKYGWRIVEPEMNWTLISHAISFVVRNPELKINMITFTIYQPRPYHPEGKVRSWRIGIGDLTELINKLNETLNSPSETLNTGDHCHYCPAMAVCPAARKAQMNAIEATHKAFRDDIDNDNLSFQLDHLKRASQVIKEMEKAYNELALYRLTKGQIIQNYALEKELSNRQWKEDITPEFLEMMTGKNLTKKQLITPKQAENEGVPKEFVEALTERRNKGVKIVRMDANTKAKKLFNQPKRGN